MIFGVPPSTLSRILQEAEKALARALVGFPLARITRPSLDRQKACAELIARRQPLLRYSWGFTDGKNFKVLQPSNPDVQNAHYNGWLHSVFVTGILGFSADGLIVWAKHNNPGSWNDEDMSLSFRKCLLNAGLCPDPRYGVVADCAFPSGENMTGNFLTPLKEGDLRKLLPSVRPVAKRLSRAITFGRQATEWGMGSVAKVYHRL